MVRVEATILEESMALFSGSKRLEFTIISENEVSSLAVNELFETIGFIMDRKIKFLDKQNNV